ncbi:CAP domain-containing protein [uncultured Roseovarius sp.]|uniref:CAP domain-containing protein n=1 Tax=uncultured Roseovarius sp. TaxID=293344 RepID=UPI0025966976|nr:CAP domain-containing protein [uncultured Roseovarius sp.]MDW3117110.1 CAP domain-containing protein [Roseovarius pacificus]
MGRSLMLAAIWLALTGVAQAQMQDLSGAAQDWVNAVRKQAKRGTLTPSEPLTRAAAAHARDLAQSGTFSHSGSDGSGVGQRVRRQGYGYCFVAENLAKGQGALAEVLQGWMGSKGHKRNMLANEAEDFALVRGPGNLWVMVLGRSGC